MLHVWLNILQAVGVDLIVYGIEESRMSHAYRSMESPTPALQLWHDNAPWSFNNEVFYFTFSYGPTPEDWIVQIDHTCEQYASDFWQSLGIQDEPDVRAMPGNWIDA